MTPRLSHWFQLACVFSFGGCNAQTPPACEAVDQLMSTNEFYESFIADKLDSTGLLIADEQNILGACPVQSAKIPYKVVQRFSVKSIKNLTFRFGQRSESEFVIVFVCTANNLSLHGVFITTDGQLVMQRVYEGAF